MFNNVDEVEESDPVTIQILEREWICVYDSPRSKGGEVVLRSRAQHRTGNGVVSLIFSSPKAENYRFATDKSNVWSRILDLPTWEKEEMLAVKIGKKIGPNVAAFETERVETERAVNSCYDIWGGNMRALDKFLDRYKESPELAIQEAEQEFDSHISSINKEFAEKMAKKLEKQDIQCHFTGKEVQNAPGQTLVPEPSKTDLENSKCYEEFRWRFCSQMAEIKFWKYAKEVGHDISHRHQ